MMDHDDGKAKAELAAACAEASKAKKVNLREEFGKIKKKLGGGMKLAYYLSRELPFPAEPGREQ